VNIRLPPNTAGPGYMIVSGVLTLKAFADATAHAVALLSSFDVALYVLNIFSCCRTISESGERN